MGSYHKQSITEVFDEFHSSPRGLLPQQVIKNRETYGENRLSEKKEKSTLMRFLGQFKNFFSLLLLGGAALSFFGEHISPGEGNMLIGYALLGVTILNAIFSFIQDQKARVAMNSFKNLLPQKILVERAGKQEELHAYELVPGDIIILREGDKIPADARVLEENLLKVDHSMLTGESEPQLRSTEYTSEKELSSRNMLFSGTLVQSGSGKAIVVRVGDATEIGKIANLTATVKKKPSKIRLEIDHFVKIISTIALILGVTFFWLGFAIGNSFWQNLVFAIGIIVANVPEGLLPTVTLTLSLAGQRMAKHKALVKDIESIETIGGVTTICTDKTGTLTENKLRVVSLFYDGEVYDYDTKHATFYNKESVVYLHHTKHTYFDRMLSAMYLCNNAIVEDGVTSGDPTEIALKQSVLNQKEVRLYHQAKRELEIPFDSEKKYMITAQTTVHHRIAYLKGAPEAVLKKCTHVVRDGKEIKLSKKEQELMLAYNKQLASKGMRILALAYKKLGDHVATSKFVDDDNYICMGLIAMQDPPRAEVKDAVAQCYEAGIRIIIMSGDQAETVNAISEQVGISSEHTPATVVLSSDLAEMTDEQLKQLLGKDRHPVIFARSLPADKLRVVRMLQELHEVVAVTGDGVNDAPALKQADVGIAMGLTGTDVAKEAANMVLLDDNFATIVKAIKSGRTVYENIKKFILYILTSNIPEILPFLFFVLFGWPLALPILLILAIDLGTDMLPAISLGKQKAEGDVMKQPPRKRSAPLLTTRMLIDSYGFVGMMQALASFVFFFLVLFSHGWTWGQTPEAGVYAMAIGAYFSCIVIMQIFDFIICRTLRKSTFTQSLWENKLGLLGIIVELLLVAVILYWPPAQAFFGTAPFPLIYLPGMIGFGLLLLFLDEARKKIYRKTGKLGAF